MSLKFFIDRIREYYISFKPGIAYFVSLTAFASAYLGSGSFEDDFAKILAISLGVMLSAGGSALINNLLDRDIDKLMKRTRKRPTALGKISSKEGYAVSFVLILLGSSMVFFYGGFVPLILNLLAVISYDIIYTLFLKRRDPFGVILGGIPGALPTFIGYYSTAGRIDAVALILFSFMFMWQPPHFWALAIKYKDDYARGKLPVMPLVYGEFYTKLQSTFYSISLIFVILLPVMLGMVKIWFLAITLPANIMFVYMHIISFKDKLDLRKIFTFSNILLLFFFGGFIVFKNF